jgi:hypothetical protein
MSISNKPLKKVKHLFKWANDYFKGVFVLTSLLIVKQKPLQNYISILAIFLTIFLVTIL